MTRSIFLGVDLEDVDGDDSDEIVDFVREPVGRNELETVET
jgi:hypothetical protein